MNYFELSFAWRVVLAAASAIIAFLSVVLLELIFPHSMRDVLGVTPYGIFLALMVLFPFVRTPTFCLVRAVALVVATVVIQQLVVWQSFATYDFLGLDWLVIIPQVLLGTMLIALATALLAPIGLSIRFFSYVAVAGLVAGFAMWFLLTEQWDWFCGESCAWWNDLYFVGGWLVWHVSLCTALFLGGDMQRDIES
jgi:hypothetical protein